MTQLWFSRVALKPEAQVQAIASLLLPDKNDPAKQKGETAYARHQLVWSLFADEEKRRRDFLWREDSAGKFLILSARKPLNDHFQIEHKEWAPHLTAGDRLAFSLRANPVVARKAQGKKHSQRHDVVMDALRSLARENPAANEGGEQGVRRNSMIQQAGAQWLAKQGGRYGFEATSVKCDGYRQMVIPRRNKKTGPIQFSVLEFDGALQVTDPAAFLQKLSLGFGAAKAFGCGLMLIRRI